MDWLTRLWFWMGLHDRVGIRSREQEIARLERRAHRAMEMWDEKIRMLQFHDDGH